MPSATGTPQTPGQAEAGEARAPRARRGRRGGRRRRGGRAAMPPMDAGPISPEPDHDAQPHTVVADAPAPAHYAPGETAVDPAAETTSQARRGRRRGRRPDTAAKPSGGDPAASAQPDATSANAPARPARRRPSGAGTAPKRRRKAAGNGAGPTDGAGESAKRSRAARPKRTDD